MTSGLELDFIVAGGARYGMGHVMRSATLASAAQDRGARVRVFLAGDRTAEERWRSLCPDSAILTWSAWRARASAPLTIFDHPFAKARWLAACRRDRTRTIVLDDARAIGRARLTINPALHHAPEDLDIALAERPDDPEDEPEGLLLRGPRYAILAPAHLRVSARPLCERDVLLVSMGGADPHGAGPKLAPILTRALDMAGFAHGIGIRRIVLGPAFDDPESRIAGELLRAGWQVERALEPAAIANRMAEARIAVVGFGTSLCELAWHGTPNLAVTHHAYDDTWSRLLEERGIGGWLGLATALDPAYVSRRFTDALRDRAWQETSAARARAALAGGRGCDRILDRLALIAREVTAQTRVSGERVGRRAPARL